MRYLSVFKAVETGKPPSPEMMEKMGKLVEDSMKKGELLATEGCLPTALGVRVRKTGDKVTVKDGPFTESKEVIGGFAILQANSKDEVISMVQKFLAVAGDGECEIRQIYDGPK